MSVRETTAAPPPAQGIMEEVLSKQEKIVKTIDKVASLSLKTLKEKGAVPEHKLTLENATIYYTKIFKKKSHYLSIALVEITDKVFPRLFYHSNTQGTWRALSHLNRPPTPFYGKGYCESDTQLPIDLISALNQLPRPKKSDFPFKEEDFVEVGIAADWARTIEYNQDDDFPSTQRGLEINPTLIGMPEDEEFHPDFTTCVSSYTTQMPHYGEVTVKIFDSKNKHWRYMFIEASDERAFLASVEVVKDVEITPYGCRKKYIRFKKMDSPLIEYRDQVQKKFRPPKNDVQRYKSGDDFVNNWNFVRELAVIKMYYEKQNRDRPEKLEAT